MEEDYRQARKRGEQGRRRAISQSEHPYLTDLDSLVAQLPLGQRENVGLRDIPLEMVVGTVTKGRQSAFSCNFMPLLPFNTEFARKWSNLYDIQVTEGYRDPIIVTEFMHRFYVQEGNKRVSVLKFLDAPTVSARVTRLYPGTWDSVESRLYGEFCAFWRVCPLYEIEFSREGSYETLAKMLGQNLIEKWPQKKVDYLRHTFLLFKRAYLRAGGDHLDITPADAMLVYLNVYNQDRLLDTPTDIVVNRLCKIWRELVIAGKNDEDKVDLVEAPSVDEEESPAKSTSGVLNFFMGKTVYSAANPLRIAFIHEFPCAASSWDSLHDQGRQYLDEHFDGIVRTEAFEDCHDPDVFYAAVETAVKHGDNVIFSTSHRLMEYTLRAAVEYPQVRFLNCSIGLPHQSVRSYFGKMYEAKFLLGALAASMADNHRIGYHASVFASGALSEINAFAIGASLLDPRAQIILTWGDVPAGGLAEAMCREGVSVMTGADMSKSLEDPTAYGLHRLVDGKVSGIAMPVWNWGRYYELIVRSLLHGTWDETSDDNQVRAVNYWYGMSSGVIDIRYAPGLPYQTRKLVQLLRNGIVEGSINPFGGELHSQNGVVQIEGFPPLPSTQIVEMNWLADNVVGTIPQLDDEPKVPAL